MIAPTPPPEDPRDPNRAISRRGRIIAVVLSVVTILAAVGAVIVAKKCPDEPVPAGQPAETSSRAS